MIEFKMVRKSFGDKCILNGVNFKVNPGEIYFVIGKSGTGKSVMLKHIVGLLHPDAGEVWVDQKPVHKLPESDLFEVRKNCGMVFQNPALLDSHNIYENVAFGLRAHNVSMTESELKSKVIQALELVYLKKDILKRFPPELSFGQQKRVSIARTLVLEPKYLLFDEPTTAQDPVNTNAINELIHKLARELKVTVIVVSHDMHCALAIASRIMLLDKGRILSEGTPDAMLHSHEPLVQDFLREAKERVLDPIHL